MKPIKIEIDKTKKNAFELITIAKGNRVTAEPMTEREMLIYLGGILARTLFDGVEVGETAYIEITKSKTMPF